MRSLRIQAAMAALVITFSLTGCTESITDSEAPKATEADTSLTESSAEKVNEDGASFLTDTVQVKVNDLKYEVYDKPIQFNFQALPYEEWLAYESPFDEYIPLLMDDGSGRLDVVQTVAYAFRYAYENDIEYIVFPIEYDMETLSYGWNYAALAFPNIPLTATGSEIELTADGHYQVRIGDSTRKAAGKSAETIAAAKEIVDSMPSTCVTDSQKAYYLYDWVCQNVIYDEFHSENTGYVNNTPQSAYGALVNKRAVCDGIASSVQLLFNMAGIDCGKIEGIDLSDDEHVGHVWNYAYIGDEVWDFDATWDINRYYLDENDEVTEYENMGFYSWFGVERSAKTKDMSICELSIYNVPLTTDLYSANSPVLEVFDIAYSFDFDEDYFTTYYVWGEEYSDDDFSPELIKNILDEQGTVVIKFNDPLRMMLFIRNFSAYYEPFYEDIDNGDLIYDLDTDTNYIVLAK